MDEEYTFARYLSAKKSVDDRALNPRVWEAFASALDQRRRQGSPRLSILEVGAGTGTMVERCLHAGLLQGVDYHAIDAEESNVSAAAQELPRRIPQYGYRVGRVQSHELRLGTRQVQIPISKVGEEDEAKVNQLVFETADLFDFAACSDRCERYDLLIANAFLDLVDAPRALLSISKLMRGNALLYLTINFDGATIFQPQIDPAFDATVERLYHETMDQRIVDGRPSGDSNTGRHLFGHLRDADMAILAAGSSDWVVFPRSDGYEADEAYFLHFIVDTVRGALIHDPRIDPDRFQAWIRRRHEQIDNNELVYIAHQLDFLVERHS